MTDLTQLMKQANAMRKQLKRARKELAATKVYGEAGGGLVRITMNGTYDVRKVEIDPALMQDDRAVLEDLIAAACNDATRKVTQLTAEKMGGGAAGMGGGLGGGLDLSKFKLPF